MFSVSSKKIVFAVVVGRILMLILIGYFVLPNFFLRLALWTLPDPGTPEITYGEFPFSLEVEINGERILIEDTVIAEFDGFRFTPGEKRRQWTSRLASGKDEIVLLELEGGARIIYPVGSPRDYMGDRPEGWGSPDFKSATRIAPFHGATQASFIEADELYSQYGIRIIEFRPSPPIVNTFR